MKLSLSTKKSLLLTILFQLTLLLIYGQDIPTPEGYQIVDEKEGDLTMDGIPEKVIVFNTNDSTDVGTIREIQVYKKTGNKWELLASSKNAIGKSKDGGMDGDPFESIEITGGILIINQSGGSSWKWFKTDKYKFQDGKLLLIGFTNNYGKPGEYFENIDFNLVTGKIIYAKEYEDEAQTIYKKENETFYKKGLKIDLTNRTSKEIKIVTPKYKNEIYL